MLKLALALASYMLTSNKTNMAGERKAQVRARATFSEIREGNQRLATQLDSKLTEINDSITNLDKTINGLVTRVTEAENRISDVEDTLAGYQILPFELSLTAERSQCQSVEMDSGPNKTQKRKGGAGKLKSLQVDATKCAKITDMFTTSSTVLGAGPSTSAQAVGVAHSLVQQCSKEGEVTIQANLEEEERDVTLQGKIEEEVRIATVSLLAVSDTVPRSVEYLVRETYNWFSVSPKRREAYKAIYDTINCGEKPLLITKHHGRQEEKGGAEKDRIKKKRMLERDSSKWSKITDLIRSQASTSRAVIEEDDLSVSARESEALGSRMETETDEEKEAGAAEEETESVEFGPAEVEIERVEAGPAEEETESVEVGPAVVEIERVEVEPDEDVLCTFPPPPKKRLHSGSYIT
ncbi:zinc finger protein [Scomber scombrus]|uniref:Zinc finger protein n=1 Tax=Scomber scombrus TaxID=13677 RepID=A0AAV1PTS7_SCOSC